MDQRLEGPRTRGPVRSSRCTELVLVLACTLLTACASGGSGASTTSSVGGGVEVRNMVGGRGTLDLSTEASVRDSILPASRASVWSALPSVFETLEMDTPTVDAASLMIGNARFRPRRRIGGERPSRYFDCGSGPGGDYADRYQVTLYLMVQLRSAPGGGTMVRTTLDASARPRDVAGGSVHCGSKGSLERRIVELILENLVRD
jgi:hypothetical protein